MTGKREKKKQLKLNEVMQPRVCPVKYRVIKPSLCDTFPFVSLFQNAAGLMAYFPSHLITHAEHFLSHSAGLPLTWGLEGVERLLC